MFRSPTLPMTAMTILAVMLTLGAFATAVPVPANAGAAPVVREAHPITPTGDPMTVSRPDRPIHGPVRAHDPAARAEIARLHLEAAQHQDGVLVRLKELGTSLRREIDPDLRFDMNREIGELKRNLELRHIEFGLEIARLDGDERRAADFAVALDQLKHPEKYAFVPRPEAVRRTPPGSRPGADAEGTR